MCWRQRQQMTSEYGAYAFMLDKQGYTHKHAHSHATAPGHPHTPVRTRARAQTDM